jgi:hypothetical protein
MMEEEERKDKGGLYKTTVFLVAAGTDCMV